MTNGAENPAPFLCPPGDEKWGFLQLQRKSEGRHAFAAALSTAGLGITHPLECVNSCE